jgi:hypothetical protein
MVEKGVGQAANITRREEERVKNQVLGLLRELHESLARELRMAHIGVLGREGAKILLAGTVEEMLAVRIRAILVDDFDQHPRKYGRVDREYV